jgi:hypothetical protein
MGACAVQEHVRQAKKNGFTGSGLLIALAIAAAMLFTEVGPTSAQFFNFGGYQQQPQRGGGWFGGGWFGNGTFEPLYRRAPASADPRGFFKGALA